MGDGTGEVVASGALSALAEEVAQGRLRLNAGVSRAASNASRVGCEEDTKAGATNGAVWTVVGDERMHDGGDAVVGVGGESNSRILACSVLSTLLQ